jgi:predicted Zn-dependent protease
MSNKEASPSATAFWNDFLSQCEADLAQAADLLEGPTSMDDVEWKAPTRVPEMLGELLPRIKDILAAQEQAIQRLEAKIVTVRQHLAYIRRDGSRGIQDVPRFVDQGL